MLDKIYVILQKNIIGKTVPSGNNTLLVCGQKVNIVHFTGFSFTLKVADLLVYVDGKYAVAINKKCNKFPSEKKYYYKKNKTINYVLIWDQLRTIYDPEIFADIVELGLIYDITYYRDNHLKTYRIIIKITLTSSVCGMSSTLISTIEERLKNINNITYIIIRLVFNPPWDYSMISAKAKLKLNLY